MTGSLCEHPNTINASNKISATGRTPVWALALAVIAVSFAAPFFRKAAPTPPEVSAGLRLLLAGLVLSPLTFRALRDGTLNRRVLLHACAAGLLYGLHFGAWVTSLFLTSVASSVTLVTVNPLLLALAALVTGRDRPSGRLWLALAVATAGLLLIGGGDITRGGDALKGDALAILGAAAMSGYLLVGRRLGPDLPLWPFTGVATLVGGLCLMALALCRGEPLTPASWSAFGYIALAALVPQLVGHGLITWSLRKIKPAVVAMAVVGEPVGATVLSWWWLNEGVGALAALGCGLTLAAVVLAVKDS